MTRFQYARTGLDFETKNPNLGNTDVLEFTRVSRKTLAGDDIVFRDPTWPKIETISHIFDFRPCDDSITLIRKLIQDSLADYFIYTDFCGNIWNALIRNPTTAIAQPEREGQTVTLELEITE